MPNKPYARHLPLFALVLLLASVLWWLGAAVRGRVVDASGRPLAQARITVPPHARAFASMFDGEWQLARQTMTALSGPDGYFFVDGLWPGHCELQVSQAQSRSHRLWALLGAGYVSEQGELVLSPGGRISGRVLDAEQRSIEGALVRARTHFFSEWDELQLPGTETTFRDWKLRWDLFGYWGSEVRTDVDGRFSFGDLDPTLEYEVIGGSTGFEPTRLHNVAVNGSLVTLTLQREALIVLTVIDGESGLPVRALRRKSSETLVMNWRGDSRRRRSS
ncbi:MAG: hypothetical protein ACI9EF_003169 [Pseudohongiellaceae bacterium]|jgi:hypothetical protein